jgi:DNA-binding transcriptional LysR family regulator
MTGSNLDDVAAFLAVVSTSSFTEAGRELDRDASVISRRVSALEARLGIRLLERSTRRVVPTAAGLRYSERMRAALGDMDDAEAEAGDTSNAVAGTLRLALPTTFGRLCVAPLLPRFLRANPRLSMEVEYADRYVDLVAERFDVAIRLGSLNDSRLVAKQIAPHRRFLCAAPSYLAAHGWPQTPEDLARHACLSFSRLATHPHWQLCRGDQTATVRVRGPLVADDAQSLVIAAVAGAGVVMCSDWLTVNERSSGSLVTLLPDWNIEGAGGIYAIRPSGRFVPGRTRQFVDWLSETFSQPPWRALVAGHRV